MKIEVIVIKQRNTIPNQYTMAYMTQFVVLTQKQLLSNDNCEYSTMSVFFPFVNVFVFGNVMMG